MSGRGIRDIWDVIVSSIESLSQANCYERLNMLASLGCVSRFRRIAASLVPCRGTILDAGCGPGTSTLTLLRRCRGRARILALDPSLGMLRRVARSGSCLPVEGRFEALPLADSSVDSVVAMFSFRDATSYRAALEEFARVLKPRGTLVVLDIFRPRRSFARYLLKGYLYGIGRLGGVVTMCLREGRSYANIIYTIDRMLSVEEMVYEMSGSFGGILVHRGPFIAIVRGKRL